MYIIHGGGVWVYCSLIASQTGQARLHPSTCTHQHHRLAALRTTRPHKRLQPASGTLFYVLILEILDAFVDLCWYKYVGRTEFQH